MTILDYSKSNALLPTLDLCTEVEVAQLVDEFYLKIRADHELGPIFEYHVTNWPDHLAQLTLFWSALLRGTRQYKGAVVTTHMAMNYLEEHLFTRWLALFKATTAELNNPQMQQLANDIAAQMATVMWERYSNKNTLSQ